MVGCTMRLSVGLCRLLVAFVVLLVWPVVSAAADERRGDRAATTSCPEVTPDAPQVFVTGAVRVPGGVAVDQPLTVVEALARAGGRTAAAGTRVLWMRSADGRTAAKPSRTATILDLKKIETGDLSVNVIMSAGDTIYVPDASSFFIRGYVSRPGQYILTSDMTVSQAVATAGGFRPEARRRVEIVRAGDGDSIHLPADMDDELLPDDVLVVERRIF